MTGGTRVIVLGFVTAFGALRNSRTAWALEESFGDEAQRRVEVVAAGERSVTAVLEPRLRWLLQDYPVALIFAVDTDFRPRDVFASSNDACLARIWLDARVSTRAVIYLVDDAHERFLVRVVPLEHGYDEVAQESLGTIVQSSIEALLAGASVGVTRRDAEAQVDTIEPVRTPVEGAKPFEPVVPAPRDNIAPVNSMSDERTFALALAYAARVSSSEPSVSHGPELGLSLARAHPEALAPALRLDVGYRLPTRWSQQGLGATFSGAGMRLTVGARRALSQRATFGMSAGGGLEWVHVVPRVTTGSERAVDTFDLFAPMALITIDLQVFLSRGLAVSISAGAESDLLGNHYDVMHDGEPSPVLTPWVVWPMAQVGLGWWP